MGNGIPQLVLDYDLADVATATAGNVNSFWLIIAFAVGIPLAFLIAQGIKGLFTS